MGLLSIFRKKRPPATTTKAPYYTPVQDELKGYAADDYLGKAAEVKHRALAAFKKKKYDLAWGLYGEQKSLYMRHASRQGFSEQQMLALDAQVHENMADVLRVEGKHTAALADILYWIIANQDRPIKRHQTKLKSYFNRCEFKKTKLKEAVRFSRTKMLPADYLLARGKVTEWMARET